ncbi:LysR family transcriptional regulator [Brevundimonas sp. GN22]
MDRLNLYRIFTHVAETRSFTKSADRLHIPRSSVSAAISDLERRLGVRLLNRTTRNVSLTYEGEALLERCLDLLASSEDIDSMFRDDHELAGRIKVDAPSRIGRQIIAPALPDFFASWPNLQIELGFSDRPVDLIQEQVDIALRAGPLVDSGLKARRIGKVRQINVASPSYLARHGTPATPDDLDHHLQVAYTSPSTRRVLDWEWFDGEKTHHRPVRWQVSTNNAEAYIACALAGLGLIQIPAYDVARHTGAGELVPVMDDHRPEDMVFSLVYPGRSGSNRRIRIFSDWLADQIARATAQVETSP